MTLWIGDQPSNLVSYRAIYFHHEDGTIWAECPQAPGWSASAESQEALNELIREAVEQGILPGPLPQQETK